jgi:precorrin-3B synthase
MPVGLVPISEAVAAMLASAAAFLRLRSADGSNAWRIAELADGPVRIAAELASWPGLALQEPAGSAPTAEQSVPSVPCPVGLIGQRNGSTALVVGIPLGRLSAVQAAELSGHDLVLTPWRSIVVPNLSGADATRLRTAADAAGLIVNGSSPWLGVTACTGRPGCAKALADVRADARVVHGTADPTGVATTGADTTGFATTGAGSAGTPVHWVGCERRCGTPAGDVLTIVATPTGYRLDGGSQSDAGPPTAATQAGISDRLEKLQALR